MRQQGQTDPPFEISDVLRVAACPEQEYEINAAASYTASINDAPTMRAADEAWHDGDMSAVVERLQPLQARLSKRDQRRVAYALRRLGGERDREGR